MTITTEEAERLVSLGEAIPIGARRIAAALRSLAAERDALRAENEKLRAENAKLAASNHAYLSDYQEARGEIEKLRDVLRAFPGFVDDATIGDVWIERKNAALGGEGNE
jgi:chromosome segregation ATPase